MESKKKLKMFPWMVDINLEVYRSCFSEDSSLHEILFQKLYNHVSTEISNILEAEDFKRAEKLLEVLNAYVLSFHMRNITFHEDPKVPKKSFIILLSSFVDLYIFLCRGDPSSAHLENCISNMFLLTGSHLYSLWDILLHCKLFNKSHSTVLLPIMKRVMEKLPGAISNPEDYMKMIVLMRYWKMFCDSKEDKREILSIANNVRPPAELLQWLSTLHIESMPELPEMEERVARHFLYQSFPKGFFKKMKELLSKGIADNRPCSTFSTDKELSSTYECSSEADGILNLSGLEDFGRNQFEEPALSEVEAENDRKKSKKGSKGRDDFHTGASAEVPSAGFFIDTGSSSVGKSQFKEPEIPKGEVKRKKKCKKKQTEDVLNKCASKELSDGEKTDIVMGDASTEIPSGNLFIDSSGFSSEGGNRSKEPELSNVARKRKKKQKQVKSVHTSNNSSSKKLSVEEQSDVVSDVFTEIPSGGFFIDTCGVNSESQFKETELPKIPVKKKKSKKKQNQAKAEDISNSSPSKKQSDIETGSVGDASAKVPPGSFFIDSSGLNSGGESEMQEPQLPNIAIRRKKRSKKKKGKSEVISNNSPSEKQTDINAPTEVPSVGLFGSPGLYSEGENQFKEPKLPNIAKGKKCKKQTQSEGISNSPPKKLSGVEEQTDIVMSGDAVYSGNKLHFADDDEIAAQSRCSELKSPGSLSAGKTVNVRKLKCKKSKKDNELLENQFESETVLEKCSRVEASLGSGIIRDVGLGEIPDDELSVETVKRQRKRKRVVELNSLEHRVNEDLSPAGNGVLQDEPGISGPAACKRSKRAKKSPNKPVNVSVKLDDLSSGVSSVIHTEHEMEDLETASGSKNDTYDFEDDLSLERVTSVAGSKKKKKKDHSPHMHTEESVSLLSHQTEGIVDKSLASKGSEIDSKCEVSPEFGSSQVVSQHDKEKKHKPKKKPVIAISEFSDTEVTPKKGLSECGSPISNLDNECHEGNKSSLVEEDEHGFSPECNSSQLVSPHDKEKKHRLKQNRVVRVSGTSNIVVTLKKKLDECDSPISDLDNECHEGNKSVLEEDEHGFSPECNSSQLVSPCDKEKKHRLKKNSVVRVSGASNIVVTPKNGLDECNSLVSDLDQYHEGNKSFLVEEKHGSSPEYNSSQLVSPRDKEKKRRLKKNSVRVSGASNIVVTPKKKLDECDSLVSDLANESYVENKSSPVKGSDSLLSLETEKAGKSEVEEDDCGVSFECNIPQLLSPIDKESKRSLRKKQHVIRVSGASDTTEVTPKKSDDGSFQISSVDGNESCERSRSFSQAGVVVGCQSANLEVTSSVQLSAKKEVKSNAFECKEGFAVRPVHYLLEENTSTEEVLENNKGPYNSFVSEHTSVDTSLSEGGSSRKKNKKPSSESFEGTHSDESFGKKEKNNSFHDSSASSNDGQCICVEDESDLSCSAADVGCAMLSADAECKKTKNDSLLDASESSTLIENEECENISAVSNESRSDGSKALKISPVFCEESEVLSVGTSGSKYSPSVKNLSQEKRRESRGDVSSGGIKMLNDSIGSLDTRHRGGDCSFGQGESFHAVSVVTEKNAGGETSGGEQKVLSDGFVREEKSEEEKMSQCDSPADIKAYVGASSMDSICDATDSSGDETSLSQNKRLQKTEVVSESESSDSSFAGEMSQVKTLNCSMATSPKKSNLGLKGTSPKKQLSVVTSSIELDESCNSGCSKKRGTRSLCSISYSADTSLKSPKTESCSPSAAVDSSRLQETPLKENIVAHIDPHKGEKLFTDSSSDSELCLPLLSRIKKETEDSGGNKSVRKKSWGVSSNVEVSPTEDLKLFIDSSSEDENSSPQTTPKKSDQPKTYVSREFLNSFEGKVSYENVEEKSGSIVSDSVKDTASDVSDVDLFASQKKNEKESFLPVLHQTVTDIQRCGSVSSLNAKASEGQTTVRKGSLSFSVKDDSAITETSRSCEVIKTPTIVALDCDRKDKSRETPISSACRVQVSSTKKHFQKSEAADGECVSKLNIICSPSECMISKLQTPQSEKTVLLQRSSPDVNQDELILSEPLNSPDDSSNVFAKDKDDSLCNDLTKGTKSPELTSQPVVVIPVTRLSDGSAHTESSGVDSSDSDSDFSSGNDCKEDMKPTSSRKSAMGICEKVLPAHGSDTKGKKSLAADNSVVLLPSGATSSPTKVSPSKESPCAKGGHNLRIGKTPASSPTKSPAQCEQNKSPPQSKHKNKSLLTSPVSSQTSSASQSVELHISVAEREENIAVENCDTSPLRHSSRIKRRKLLCSSDKNNSSILETPKVSEKENSVSTPLRHSSRRKKLAFFPGEKLSATKNKKSPFKVCLSESSSMMDVKNHLDFSDLKTSPQSSQARSKNSSPSPKESSTVTTEDVANLDDVKSAKSSLEVDFPQPSWKSRLRTPARAERENSPASSTSSTNVPETLNDHSSNGGESETPVWKRTATTGGFFPSEPKRYTRKKNNNGTVTICQSLKHLCLATPCSSVIHRLPEESLPKRTSNEISLADSVLEDTKSSDAAETASGTDDEAVPSTKSSPVKKDLVKKNPFNDVSNSPKVKTRSNIPGTSEKAKEELVTSSCSKVRTKKNIFGTSEKDKEGYNLRPRKSLIIMPPKLNI